MSWSSSTGWNNQGWSRPAAPPASTTFNPGDKSPDAVLSNGNLTITSTTSNSGARSINSFSGNKKFFSFHIDNYILANAIVGIGTAAAGLSGGDILFSTGMGAGVGNGGTGAIADGSGGFALPAMPAAGDYVDVATDDSPGVKKIWMRLNGGDWWGDPSANPATGVGGMPYTATGPLFAFAMAANNNSINTFNFGATAYAYAAPAGFGNL